MKKTIAIVLTIVLMLLGLPLASAEIANQADLTIEFKPVENTSGNVVLEIDMIVNNGESGQYINNLEFRYENALIASVDALAARSNSFARSTPLNLSLISMPDELEVEMSYVDFDGSVASKNLKVSHQAAEPKVSFTRTASATACATGEKIRLTYIIKNEGSVLLTDLQLSDDMESIGPIETIESIYPGELREITVDVKMTKDVKSLPRLSYKSSGSTQGMVMVLEAMELIIYNPKLNVTLKSDFDAVQAGDSVTLVCNVINEGNVAFTNVSITDTTLGTVIESTKIEVGKAYSWNKLIRPVNSQNYMYTVKAVDANGKVYTATSNIVAVEVSNAGQTDSTEVMEVTVTPNTKVLDQPGEITFNILLRNISAQPLGSVVIYDSQNNVVERLNSLPVGDRVLPIAVNITETGDYFFVIDATLPNGESVQKITTPIAITIGVVQPDGQPSASDALTPTPSPLDISKNSGGMPPWLLMLLIVIVLLIIACVAVLVWLQLRANRKNDDDDDDYTPGQQDYARPQRPAPPVQDPFDYREEISRAATEYSKPVQQPTGARRPVERSQMSRPSSAYDDDDDVQTVYKVRKPSEPRTRRND